MIGNDRGERWIIQEPFIPHLLSGATGVAKGASITKEFLCAD